MPGVQSGMARNSSPSADDLLDKPIQVLDHGFVRLVDYLGSDSRIVQAARVSYGEGTKTVREDAALIDYLLRNRHTSPFEMVELTLHIKAPIFVARQWLRHRSACLAGDVRLYFDQPSALPAGTRKRLAMRVDDFHRKWHDGYTHRARQRKTLRPELVDPATEYSVSELSSLVGQRAESIRNLLREGRVPHRRATWSSPTTPVLFVKGSDWLDYIEERPSVRKSMRDRLKNMNLRMCDESTGEIRHTRVVDIWSSGVKAVFKVTLSNGYSIKMSKDHRCLTESGWLSLADATGLRLRDDGGVTWRSETPRFAVNGSPAYRDREWLATQRSKGLSVSEIASLAGVSYMTIRKHLRLNGLQYSPSERAKLSGNTQRGQRRTLVQRPPLTQAALASIRAARSGPMSNFWKGGVTSERSNIGRWTREQAKRVHARWGRSCALCSSKSSLHAHHVDPIWHNLKRARDFENLMSLCGACHSRLHSQHLELALLAWHSDERPLASFWTQYPRRMPRPATKPRPRVRRLVRGYAAVVKIEFVGNEMTYDLEVEGPYHNFVADGFVVHNSVNEVSGRYSVLADEFYLPTPEQVRAQGKRSRQVGEGPVEPDVAKSASESFDAALRSSYSTYQELLESGVAREMAREVLPVGLYTEFYWKQDLHNLFHFLRLRMDWHAQYEIRAYGDAVARCAEAVAPVAYKAFEEHILHGRNLARTELELIRGALDLDRLRDLLEESGMRKSRQQELLDKLGLELPARD
jgi:thymidylate synthase (FAD)